MRIGYFAPKIAGAGGGYEEIFADCGGFGAVFYASRVGGFLRKRNRKRFLYAV